MAFSKEVYNLWQNFKNAAISNLKKIKKNIGYGPIAMFCKRCYSPCIL